MSLGETEITLIALQFHFVQMFGVFLKEINTFIHQGCIKLIKSENKDINYVTNDFYFK